MKINSWLMIALLFACSLLTACNKSSEPSYYTITACPFNVKTLTSSHTLKIGIDVINIPEYLDSPYLKIFSTPNQSQMLEDHQWAGPLEANIQRVIQTDLTTKLPNAAVELAPWDSTFYPDYHLNIEITQFNVDVAGNSVLRVIYTIEENNKEMVHQYQAQFFEKLSQVTPATMVISMNHQISRLTDKIAINFRSLKRRPH